MIRADRVAGTAAGGKDGHGGMAITLSNSDFVPLEAFEFQHWGDRDPGRPPFDAVRPLSADAARRVFARASRLGSETWDDADDALCRLDLRADEGWSPPMVREWLLARVGARDVPVIACFQPTTAVVVPWGVLCDHWMQLLWTGGCVWPVEHEAWVLVHDGDQFAFGHRASGGVETLNSEL